MEEIAERRKNMIYKVSICEERGNVRERVEDNAVTKRRTGTEKRGGRTDEDRGKKVRDDDEVDAEETE